MTIASVPSFINAALTAATSTQSSHATLANLVEKRNEEEFANRIGGAWAALVNERTQLMVLDKEDGGTRVKDMVIKPEPFLGFCQYLLNQACWAARRYVRAQQANADQEAINGITGIDFSQDVAADLGIPPMDTQEIEEALSEDFTIMQRLYSVLACKMNYLSNIDDLHLFADRQKEGEVWRVIATADTFADAESIMNAATIRMKEREAANLVDEMANMDFAKAS